MSNTTEPDPRRVFVVHGRDMATRNSLFTLLRAFGLQPIEWSEAVRETGTTMPSVPDVLRYGLTMAKAVVVLLTPDDRGSLRRQFLTDNDPEYERQVFGQPRLNVIFEAGLACALFPTSTIFVERGTLRPFTDIEGILRVRISRGQEWKSELRRRLNTAGCAVEDNDAWLSIGGFHPSLQERWSEYESHSRRYTDLLDRDELTEARQSQELLSAEVRAFCLVSSVQEAWDMAYWVQVNTSSEKAALLLAEFLVNSPLDHGRPRFRAARALQMFDREIADKALSAAKSQGGPAALPLNAELIDAAMAHRVEDYTRKTPLIKSAESRELLLIEYRQFPPSGQIRLT